MTTTFDTPVRRILASASGGVILESSGGRLTRLPHGRKLRFAGDLFLEPRYTGRIAWCAFRSWRSRASDEKHKERAA